MRPYWGLSRTLSLGKTLVDFLGPLQQEEKMEKPSPLGATGVAVSSYLELVSYDKQRVSRFPFLQVSCGKRTFLASELEP